MMTVANCREQIHILCFLCVNLSSKKRVVVRHIGKHCNSIGTRLLLGPLLDDVHGL